MPFTAYSVVPIIFKGEFTVVIVYFSQYNNTKAAAEYLAAKTQAVLVRLRGAGGVNPLRSMLQRAVMPQGDVGAQIAGHERLILMSPIYAFNGVPEIRGFLKHADLRGKRVAIITSGLAVEGRFSTKVSGQYTELIAQAGGKVELVLHHQGGEFRAFSGEAFMQQQVDGILPRVEEWLRG